MILFICSFVVIVIYLSMVSYFTIVHGKFPDVALKKKKKKSSRVLEGIVKKCFGFMVGGKIGVVMRGLLL